MQASNETKVWLDQSVASFLPGLNREAALVLLILTLAIFSRFYEVGERVMGFDEINHVVPGYDFSQGRGYRYDPVTHGPLQFHMIALSFFILGDNDTSARLPAVLFGIGTILFVMLAYRRFLGRGGALAAGFFLLISPYMLFYSRYIRNEIYIAFWAAAMLYTVLAYLESGKTSMLYLFTLINALHFTDKATAYIFAGEIAFFLGLFLIWRILRQIRENPEQKRSFIDRLRDERSFDLLLLEVTLVMPLSAALLIRIAGFDPLDTTQRGLLISGLFILPLAFAAILTGCWWRRGTWLKCMVIFWIVFGLFYSTFFSNTLGIPMGLVGSLGYWMSQQAVQRGNQPLYYYLLVQLPTYEFLPLIGTLVAIGVGLRHKLWQVLPGAPFQSVGTGFCIPSPPGRGQGEGSSEDPHPNPLPGGKGIQKPIPTLTLLVFWSISNLILFSLAGERMPWLTVHIALPMILATGWGIGYLIETTCRFTDIRRMALLICFAFLGVLTIRTAIRAAFINYDTALEFLVYAHSARGPKDALTQIEEISYRTTGAKDIVVAYDNNANYPYWWYLRDYPNRIYYGENPTRELRNDPIVLVGEEQFSKVEPILGKDYFKIETMRLWWPMQDYDGLTWERMINALSDPLMRNAVFQIWFNRNYQPYAELEKRSDLTLANWRPGQRMRLYIRKDVVAQMWNYGEGLVALPPQVDSYAAGKVALSAEREIGSSGTAAGQFNAPRQVAFAADGSLYVADSRNHRIQHLSADGKTVIAQWGTFADVSKGNAPGGTFYEPWGIAVGLDGSVYVADTWNNRIQKFSAEGRFISTWGSFGTGTRPDTFWGPRGLAVDGQGNLFVTDTGNKRIVVFDAGGEFITQFGSAGSGPGQFDEPVAVAIDQAGLVYVSDTWNQRIQIMASDASGKVYSSLLTWNIDGWLGQSLENKPFIAVDHLGRVFVSDPEGYRVLEFKTTGEFIRTWDSDGTASGVSIDSQGNVWVSDATNMKLLRFSIIP
jgi:uncharacterized protein (TIGR03663 family)